MPDLLIQTAFLGDVVLTTGLLNALAGRWGPLDVVTTPAAAELLAGHPAVRQVLAWDKAGRESGLGGLFRMARRLRVARYPRAWLPHRSVRSAALAVLAGIPERIGFRGSPGTWGYTRRVARPGSGHEAERLLALAEPEPLTRATVSLGLTEADRAEAHDWLRRAGVTGPFVALAPGSIWGSKRWPGYPALAAALAETVVVIGSREDAPLAATVSSAAGPRGRNAAGALSLRGTAALLEQAAMLVTNDSAPLHLAAAVGIPTVAIFGPTVPAFGFGPRGPDDLVVEVTGLACRPCSSHGPAVCPLGHHRCMQEVPVAQVLAAVSGSRRAAGGQRER